MSTMQLGLHFIYGACADGKPYIVVSALIRHAGNQYVLTNGSVGSYL